MRARLVAFLAICIVPSPTLAQHEDHGHADSPYAGQESSEISSLTAREMVGLLTGAGMGFAKAAELNHYPGPKHALELAKPIDLTDDQRIAIFEIQSRMLGSAVELGQAIIDAERELDRRFEHGHVTEETLSSSTRKIALLYGELRYTHLRAHLATRDVLQPEQVAEYDRQRGYEAER